MVEMRIEDESPGILEDKLGNIFQRFYIEWPENEKFGTYSRLGPFDPEADRRSPSWAALGLEPQGSLLQGSGGSLLWCVCQPMTMTAGRRNRATVLRLAILRLGKKNPISNGP